MKPTPGLVPFEPEPWELPAISPDSLDTWPVVTTFATDTVEDRAKVYELILGPCHDGRNLLGQEVAFGDWIIHHVTLLAVDGIPNIPAARLLLIQPDSLPVEFVSVSVLKSMKTVAEKADRLPPYDPPLVVRVSLRKRKDGSEGFHLKPVMAK